MSATLNGKRVTSARVNIPAWGRWYAEVQLDGEVALDPGARGTLVLADLTLLGTVLSGGPALGRSSYRIVAGNGGWGKAVAAVSYADDAGVKVSKVIGDAALAAGETMVIDTTARIGPGWTRDEGPASDALHALAPSSWYVDESGVTRLGKRAPGVLPARVTRVTPIDRARGRVVLAADSIAAILPGVVVDGMAAVDVLHEVSAEGGLRSTVWGGASVPALDSMRQILEALDPDRHFRGVTEYRVDTLSGSRMNLQPVRSSTGMPYLKLVTVRPGVAGCKATVALASRVLVGFVESDPSRPYVAAFEDADGTGFMPTSLALLAGTAALARVGDEVTVSSAQILAATMVSGGGPVTVSLPLKGTITTGSTKVTCG